MAVLLPVAALFCLYSSVLTHFLFGRGAFDTQAVYFTSIAVMFYSLGITFVGIRELLSRYYYAFGDTKTPMQNATFGVTINIVLNLTISPLMGIGGLALATSISAVVTTILMWIECEKKLGDRCLNIKKKELYKIIIVTAIMAVTSKGLFFLLPFGETGNFFLAVFVGVSVYIAGIYILKLEIAVTITEKIIEICNNKLKQ